MSHEKEKGMEQHFFRASAEDFKKIPGSPIAYWVSHALAHCFSKGALMSNITPPKKGIDTGSNDTFLRFWFEPIKSNITFQFSLVDMDASRRWFRYNKGGGFRKWFGNNDYVVNWENNGLLIKSFSRSTIRNEKFLRKNSLTWSDVTSSRFSARYSGEGALHDNSGPCAFGDDENVKMTLGFLCSKLSNHFLSVLNPTLHYQIGNIASLPIINSTQNCSRRIIETAITFSRSDWNAYETSWGFTSLPLLQPVHHQPTLQAAYQNLRTHWQEMTLEMQNLEEENNRIFIEAYCLQDELTSEVPLKEITLTCNPHYRYGGNKSDEELEVLLLADTMKEFISYAVGCMFGRYALERPGLILANQGEASKDYLKQIPEPSFPADDDNVIPMLDGDWFTDDITERFFKFLRITFGEDHYEENLKFIEQAIGKNIRKYFLKDFYTDHWKRYKKRPIYWLFSSPKGSFNALIYMHRYRPDTTSVVLNDYLREFRTKLSAHKNHLEAVSISASAAPSEKTKALKEIEKLNKVIVEIEEYEREVLYPLATEQVEIDLDDGVNVNYNKFGNALKKIPGLSAKGE